jgi:hypothetical protein
MTCREWFGFDSILPCKLRLTGFCFCVLFVGCRLHEREVQSLIESGSCSDSFYFVNNKLIMHNKARYQYVDNASSSSSEKKRGGQ